MLYRDTGVGGERECMGEMIGRGVWHTVKEEMGVLHCKCMHVSILVHVSFHYNYSSECCT